MRDQAYSNEITNEKLLSWPNASMDGQGRLGRSTASPS